MISIGRNPGPRYLVARKEKLHAGNVIPNNLKIASLWFVWWDIWWGLDLQCKFKFARFVSPVSIFRITILEQYKPVASLLPTPHHTQIQASPSAPATYTHKYKPVAPLLPPTHTNTSQSLRSCQSHTQIQASRFAPAKSPHKLTTWRILAWKLPFSRCFTQYLTNQDELEGPT